MFDMTFMSYNLSPFRNSMMYETSDPSSTVLCYIIGSYSCNILRPSSFFKAYICCVKLLILNQFGLTCVRNCSGTNDFIKTVNISGTNDFIKKVIIVSDKKKK